MRVILGFDSTQLVVVITIEDLLEVRLAEIGLDAKISLPHIV